LSRNFFNEINVLLDGISVLPESAALGGKPHNTVD